MKVLISEKLSEHKYKTPEGYLICTDAILARTGKQSYTKDELFQDGDNTEVNVDRPYDEVMNAKTIASFENKPITFDHPDEDVNVGNYKDYAIGYVRDVRQGKTDKGEDVILGNLVITDQDAINAIEQGDHTDLSCGYDCDIRDDGNGNYSQTNIRGNHLALCEQGRAGIARIVDSKINDKLSYEAASSDDNYLDEVEKMIYKFANVRVDAMLVGDKLKIAARNSKGFNSKQLNDIAAVLMKNVAVSNITISNPDRFDSNVTAKIVDSKVEDEMNYSEEMKAVRNALRHIVVDNKSEMKQLIQDLIDNKPMNYSLEVRRLKRAIDELIKWSDNRQEGIDTIWAIAKENRIVDSKVEDSLSVKEKKLCNYMLENALDDGEDENDLLKKMKVYYSEYSNLARSKPNEVLQYFKSHINDSKVEDAAIGGHYKNNRGENFFICSYGSGFSIFKADGEYLDGSKHLSLDGVKQRISYYNLTKVKDSAKDSIMKDESEDWTEMLIKLAVKNGKNSSGDYEYDGDADVNQVRRVLKKLGYKDNGYVKNPKSYLHKLHYYFTDSEILEDMSSDPVVVEDVNYSEKEIKEAAMKLLKQKPFLTYEEALQKVKENIRNGNYLLDDEIEDAGWKTTKMASGIIHELGNKRIIEEENEKGDIQYRIGGTNGQVFSSLEAAKNAIRRKHLDAKDSKEMTMSDAIKMLNIVNVYKKVRDSYIVVRNKSKYEDAARKLGLTIEKDSKKLRIYGDRYKLKQLQNQFDNDEEISYVVIKDASKNEWVIKNTGLAYEIWNQGKMVKKFPTKKLAIEWIHSRFPTDEIIEDSTKDGRLWQTLTRKAKH